MACLVGVAGNSAFMFALKQLHEKGVITVEQYGQSLRRSRGEKV